MTVRVVVTLLLGTSGLTPIALAQEGPRATVERAVRLAGGEAALRGVERVTFQMMTQWQRATFRAVPNTDRPSFESHTDVRDYTIPAWRNTREFGTRRIVNVVRDSVALTDMGQGGPKPLSVAYVDERNELFLYTPDRLLLALLDAPDLAAAPDTLIGSERHRATTATLGGRFKGLVFFHAGTGLPTMLRFRAGHPNDFGLVPWGTMEVEVWYSAWRTLDGISLPTQWDIRRVGLPYKRMTVLRATINPAFAGDSFAVTPEQRSAYLASPAVRPMHESMPAAEPKVLGPALIQVGPFGMPAGAVRAGNRWVMLGAGHAPFNYRRARVVLDSLGARDVAALVVGNASAGNGGVVVALESGLPVWVSAASEPFVRRMLANAGITGGTIRKVVPGTALGTGEGQVRLEPLDLPDVPGSMMLFQEATGWLYIPDAESALDLTMARERAAALGWSVKAVGTGRSFHS